MTQGTRRNGSAQYHVWVSAQADAIYTRYMFWSKFALEKKREVRKSYYRTSLMLMDFCGKIGDRGLRSLPMLDHQKERSDLKTRHTFMPHRSEMVTAVLTREYTEEAAM